MAQVEHLEGSGGRDVLKGDEKDNTILGRAGHDDFYGLAGDDLLHTHSEDYDGVIDCGTEDLNDGDSKRDRLRRDFRAFRSDQRDNQTGSCLDVAEEEREYEFAHDVNILGAKPTPVGLYRLGERFGAGAYVALDSENQKLGVDASAAYSGSYTQIQPGVVPFSEDKAVKLTSGSVDVGDPISGTSHIYDPATYGGSGYSVSLWVKFNSANSSPGSGNFQYVFSKFRGAGPTTSNYKGVFMRRNSAGKIVFGTKRTSWDQAFVVESDAQVVDANWHHLVGTISGKTISLFVDKVLKSKNNPPDSATTAFPDSWNSSGFVVGQGFPYPSALPATVDSLAIYGVALDACQVRRHFDLSTTLNPIPGCPS